MRIAKSCQGVICGKSSAERSAKYPLSLFCISVAEKFRISASFTVELSFDDFNWLDIAAYFDLWCRGMFRFGCQQYMFMLHVVDYITFICV